MNLKNKQVALSAGTNWFVPILGMINMSKLELHWITYVRQGKGDMLREILCPKILVRDREGKFLYWDIRIDYVTSFCHYQIQGDELKPKMEDEERGPVIWGGVKVEEAPVLERRVWNQEKRKRIIRVF